MSVPAIRKPVGLDLIPRTMDSDYMKRQIEERMAYNQLMGRKTNTGLLTVVLARCEGKRIKYLKA